MKTMLELLIHLYYSVVYQINMTYKCTNSSNTGRKLKLSNNCCNCCLTLIHDQYTGPSLPTSCELQ